MPLWLNADIITGPVDATATPLEPGRFLKLCQTYFPDAVLSVGWTTKFGPDIKSPRLIISEGSYSFHHVKQLRDSLVLAGVRQPTPVTFPVRAGLLTSEESRTNIMWLLNEVINSHRILANIFLL